VWIASQPLSLCLDRLVRKVRGYLRFRRRLLSAVLVDLNAQRRREFRSEGTGLHGCLV
jgi:hypothetical protein